MVEFKGWEKELIHRGRVGRLAKVDEKGEPYVVPVVYVFDGKAIFTPMDRKPKKYPERKLKRIKNIESNLFVAFLVDSYLEDWRRLCWVQLRGRAEMISGEECYEVALSLLHHKYHQYREMSIGVDTFIRIVPFRLVSWRWDG